MRRLACAFALFFCSAPCSAADRGLAATLQRLEPETRFHQVCDIETMKRIQAERGAIRPDRMVIDAIRPASEAGDTLSGDGGAIRSGGKWYRLAFSCRASTDRMRVLSLSYRIGGAIPEKDWERYGLWR
ncbi:DUF930 domain-containing protein [Hansschlegelia sp.]|uniref:DUF930 domain-containing protein n=1 Tax=Hansschlegelia sp. TaxID=2041892 RepID=UPI002CDF5313|nr:DUF930 domain-containing protein [Hansschlegelia sp.]HVI28166.1 DUF930 domain-containing protein [Hansschlegelia sp.]